MKKILKSLFIHILIPILSFIAGVAVWWYWDGLDERYNAKYCKNVFEEFQRLYNEYENKSDVNKYVGYKISTDSEGDNFCILFDEDRMNHRDIRIFN